MTSEVGLTNVAREHEKLLATDLDDDTAYDSAAEHQQAHAEHIEVLDPDGKRRRLDLLLVRAGGRRDEPHYFVIELKRPSRRLRPEEHTSELQSLMRTSNAVFCLKTKKQLTT